MPNYDYKCDKCSHEFEIFQTMSEDPLKECPQCKGPVRRLIGAGAGLIFKGSGFYITDYKNRKKDDSSSSSSASADKKKESGTEKNSAKKEEK